MPDQPHTDSAIQIGLNGNKKYFVDFRLTNIPVFVTLSRIFAFQRFSISQFCF